MSSQCRNDYDVMAVCPQHQTASSFQVCFSYALRSRQDCTTAGHIIHTTFHVKGVPRIVQCGSLESFIHSTNIIFSAPRTVLGVEYTKANKTRYKLCSH